MQNSSYYLNINFCIVEHGGGRRHHGGGRHGYGGFGGPGGNFENLMRVFILHTKIQPMLLFI